MCLTSELEMGCMVPCSRKGEWVGDGVGGGGTVSCRGRKKMKKEGQMRLENEEKRGSR